jgi:hypothetical protein
VAAQTIELGETQEIALSTALQEIRFGDGVGTVWLSCASDAYLSFDAAGVDGGAISATARMRIPAGTLFPIPRSGKPTFVAAVTGTPAAGFLGVS